MGRVLPTSTPATAVVDSVSSWTTVYRAISENQSPRKLTTSPSHTRRKSMLPASTER